jgi:SAM-dependent methyltransferase
MSQPAEHYILATGKKDVQRLRLLHEAYGPGTEAALHRAGLHPGIRVVEVGSGSGNIACWVAEQVGPSGSVVGIDNSSAQVEQARKNAKKRGLTNIEFQLADAYAPPLPEGTFDLAYCRLVLMHLTDPLAALRSIRSLVKPGGKILCEELDLEFSLCDPAAEAFSQFVKLNHELGHRRGEHFRLGASLHRLFREAGLANPQVHSNFPMVVRGEVKRVLWLTFVEFAPELVREQLATQATVDQVAAELKALADDDTTLFGLPLTVQVWAQR